MADNKSKNPGSDSDFETKACEYFLDLTTESTKSNHDKL